MLTIIINDYKNKKENNIILFLFLNLCFSSENDKKNMDYNVFFLILDCLRKIFEIRL